MDIIAKELDKKSGIYCIENTFNGKKYVGSSKNICRRLLTHRSYLRKGVHVNSKLQNSWDKHGEQYFKCYAIEFCDISRLAEREQYYINLFSPWYNITKDVLRLQMSKESKLKMSNSRKLGFEKGTIKNYQNKPVHQYSLDGEYLNSFSSIKEASQITHVSRSSINRYFEGKYRKGGNYLWSFEKVNSLPKYKKAKKDNSFLNKPIEVLDLVTRETIEYPSVTIFSQTIGKHVSAVRHAMFHDYPYLERYMIKRICRSHE